MTDRFIPPGLADATDSQAVANARLVVALGFAGVPLFVAFAIRDAVLLGNSLAAIPLVAAAFVVASVPALVWAGVAPVLAGNVLAGALFLAIGTCSFFRGGFVTQVLLWNLFIPIATALIRKRTMTFVWSGLVVLEFLLLYTLMQRGDAGLVPNSSESPLPLLGALAMSLTLALSYASSSDRAEREKAALGRRLAEQQRLEWELRAKEEAVAAVNQEHARRLEERVRTSEEHFRILVESMDDTVFTLDLQQRYTGVFGGGLAEQAGSAGRLLGKAPREIFGEEAATHEAAGALALAGERATYEWTMERPEGARYFHTSLSPLRDRTGEVTGLVGVSREISEHKKLQAQLMVSDRMASIGTLAAGVAHEINNPLASVMANLDLAAREIDERGRRSSGFEELAEELRDAQEGAERVRQIVRDLKIFSRSEDSDRRGPVDVRRTMESSLRMAWNEIRHRARLVKNYGDVPPVIANESRLGQVFLNLIINAAQAIPEGQADANEIRVTTHVDGSGRVIIEVADTGPGIPPEILPRLFTPFLTTKPVGVGTGLGLAICHRLVTSLGGEILVDTRVGRGTTFSVALPRATWQADATTAAPSIVVGRRGRVLVIDDEPMITHAMIRILSGHEVTAVNSAREAVALFANGDDFDAILCDLMMPEMTGMDLHAELMRTRPEAAARMVFVTGGAFTPHARAFLDRTSNQRVEKPFDTMQLRALVADRVR